MRCCSEHISQSNINPKRSAPRELLDPALLNQATKDQTHNNYGFGFYILKDGACGHGGGSPGMNGELHILPQSGYVIVALANRDPFMATNMVGFYRIDLAGPNENIRSRGRAALMTEVQAWVQPLPWYQATVEAAHSYGRINYCRIVATQTFRDNFQIGG
jgi:hypothetical protein